MSERQETIDDIIAWLRRPREGENAYLTAWRDEIADRLEAAHKRERGDSAALREALKAAELGLFRWLSGSISRDEHRELVATIKTALAATKKEGDAK